MYWTNWNDQQASIMSSYLSGWDVKWIIRADIKTPNGLAVDHPAKKLYWSDAQLDKIERCNFDGSGRKVRQICWSQSINRYSFNNKTRPSLLSCY